MPGSTPADQARKDYGPIPEGTYWLYPEEVQDATLNPFLWNRLEYYPPSSSWGSHRVPLHPDEKTDLKGRSSGFFLHGGAEFGSKGCIDVAQQDEVIDRLVRQRGCSKIKVIVKYRDKNIRVPEPVPDKRGAGLPPPHMRYYP